MTRPKSPNKDRRDDLPSAETLVQKPARPLIFVSHDHRDSPLAEAFANLLTDASGGFLKSFRSSDRKGGAGIEFGAEWYTEIMGKIGDATDVVALLTSNSIDRPWILYEAGVAKGRLGKPVFGVVMGVAFDQATKGPFAQFQNSGDDEDSLTKLVLQLIKRNSDAEPREEAVRREVNAFREGIKKLAPVKPVSKATDPVEVDANAVAKLFEEIKVMFGDLPEKLQAQVYENLGPRMRKRRRMHPMMVMDMLRHSGEEVGDPALAWLMVISNFKDEAPWLYEVGLEVYHAMQGDDQAGVSKAIGRLERVLSTVRRGPLCEMMIDSPEMEMAVHELGRMAHHLTNTRRLSPPDAPLTASALMSGQRPRLSRLKLDSKPAK
ncbi:MAG: toll/interleukin-1 receptor domain-containing protein [Bryobacteraceae bacterium]|jgi:hypothetical protein